MSKSLLPESSNSSRTQATVYISRRATYSWKGILVALMHCLLFGSNSLLLTMNLQNLAALTPLIRLERVLPNLVALISQFTFCFEQSLPGCKSSKSSRAHAILFTFRHFASNNSHLERIVVALTSLFIFRVEQLTSGREASEKLAPSYNLVITRVIRIRFLT